MESNSTNNFDLKKFITENKLTSLSKKINEQEEDVQLPTGILIQYTTSGQFYGLYVTNVDGSKEKIKGVDNANQYIEDLTGTPSDLPFNNYAYGEDDVEAAAQSLRELGIQVSHNDDFDAE